MSDKQKTTALETVSTKFVAEVERQFTAEMGTALAFTEYEKTLAQHLFLKVDAALKALEDKRLQRADANSVTPYTWNNVNLPKLALDAVHRISLGLDALIPNHIHPIPYFNSKLKKYDLDLRIGYAGKDYCRRKLAVEEPVEVIYQLVYETDKFKPIMKSLSNEIEGYEFEITQPFNRGKVVGGFGYIRYEDPRKNRLVIVTERDFKKAEQGAKTKDFWGEEKWREEMMFKTIVHRVADKLPLDPRKVNAKSYAYIEAQEADDDIQREIDEHANKTVIDVTAEHVDIETGEVMAPGATEPPATEPEVPKAPTGKVEQQTLAPTGTNGQPDF